MAVHFVLTAVLALNSVIGIACQVYHDPLPDFSATDNSIPTLWEEKSPDPWDIDYFGDLSYPLTDNFIKEEEGIMVLHKGNFDNVVRNIPNIIVVFYSPKCDRSRKFMPLYNQIGGELKAKNSAVKLGKINVDTDGHLLRYGAGDLPLFIMFKNQLASPQYHGQKEKQPLVQWIEQGLIEGIQGSFGYSPYRRRTPEISPRKDFYSFSSNVFPGREPYYPRQPPATFSPPMTPTPVPHYSMPLQLTKPPTSFTSTIPTIIISHNSAPSQLREYENPDSSTDRDSYRREYDFPDLRTDRDSSRSEYEYLDRRLDGDAFRRVYGNPDPRSLSSDNTRDER